jgi:hypothetical protein
MHVVSLTDIVGLWSQALTILAARHNGLQDLELTSADWRHVDVMIDLLGPLKSATTYLSQRDVVPCCVIPIFN